MARILRIAVALIEGEEGRLLLVRKRGSAIFMQPGGKIEPGETPRAALIRELAEELALEIPPAAPEFVGRFEAPAANEPGFEVHAEVFRLRLGAAVGAAPRAEIEEILWLDPSAARRPPLAPLLEALLLRREGPAEMRSGR